MKRIIQIIITPVFLALFLYGCGELFPFIYEILVNENPNDQYVYMGDPYILNDKGTYYLYGTTSDNGIEVYMSDNLQSWGKPAGNYRGFALHEDDVWGDHWFWAPEVYKINNKYYMYYTVEEHIAVAISDSPLGPFKQDIKSPIISSKKAIDPHLFINDDGQAYLYFVLFNNGNEIWSARLNSDLVSIQEGTMSAPRKANVSKPDNPARVTANHLHGTEPCA